VQLPKSVEAPQIAGGATLPARIALAELLGNMRGRIEQADAAYRQLAGDFPQNCEIEAGQAEFAWRQRKLEDAATHFARAVELGCKDLPGLLLYARVLGYARRDQEAVAVLTSTAGLFPESDEVRLELGSTLVRTGDYGAAVAALVAVKKVTSSDEAYRLYSSLAYAQYRLGDASHARLNVAKARSYTTNPAELASLDRLQQAVSSDESGSVPAPGLPLVEGMLENMECGKLARLHVRVDGAVRIFVIPDPTRVVTRTGSGGAMRMQCGPQRPPRAVRIEYQELPAAEGVAGLVRTLDFK
jgi:Flp pilus assembly protein TadD